MKNKIIRKRLNQDRFDAVKVLKDAKVSHKTICDILKIGHSSISRIIASNYDYEEYKATNWNEKIEKVNEVDQFEIISSQLAEISAVVNDMSERVKKLQKKEDKNQTSFDFTSKY